eukprot:UN29465
MSGNAYDTDPVGDTDESYQQGGNKEDVVDAGGNEPNKSEKETGSLIKKEHGEDFLNYENSTCNDVLFAILFTLHCICIVVAAGFYGNEIDWKGEENAEGFSMITFMILLGCFGGVVFVQLMKHCAGLIMHTIFLIQPFVCFALASLCATKGAWEISIVLFIFGVALLIYYCVIRSRIPFAVETLHMAGKVVKAYPYIICLSILSVFIQAVWIIVWAIAFIGYLEEKDDEDEDPEASQVFLMLVSFYWSLEVCRYIVYVTMCGVTAGWICNPDGGNSNADNALKRATTTSFGSICLAALLISILKAIHTMFTIFTKSEESDNKLVKCATCIIDCILSCLEKIMEWFNQLGLLFVAIYGCGYLKA